MLNRILKQYLTAIFSVVFLVSCFIGCRTHKNVIVEKTTSEKSFVSLSMKTLFSISMGEQQLLSVNGQIRIRKDSLIVLSFQPFAGVEVARMSFSNDEMLVVDRMNKRYYQTTYEQLRKDAKVELNYHTLQATLCNDLFVYENDKAVDQTDFNVQNVGDVQILRHSSKTMLQEFTIDKDKRLQSALLQNADGSIRLNNYNFVGDVSGSPFPMKMEFIVQKDVHHTLRFVMTHKRIDVDQTMNFSNKVPSGYQQLSFSDLQNLLKGKK